MVEELFPLMLLPLLLMLLPLLLFPPPPAACIIRLNNKFLSLWFLCRWCSLRTHRVEGDEVEEEGVVEVAVAVVKVKTGAGARAGDGAKGASLKIYIC
ncbi:hypothetical protein RclHR1_09010008 [Rhizophagus clarus]|uniref:Secreted protein n=1 Tax=Rhizophagus clarus TaxID=94130 RepID=A0A2Z6SDI5_9GLOM|nr:hypothetical protein RclHR1_09010008 [Rhizophagus clarus]